MTTDFSMGFEENVDAEAIEFDDAMEEDGYFHLGGKKSRRAKPVQPKNQGDDSESESMSVDESLETGDKDGPKLSSEEEDSQTSGSMVTSDTPSDSSSDGTDEDSGDSDSDEDDSDEDDSDSDNDSEDSDDDEDEESDDLSSSEESEDDSDSDTNESDDETTTESSYDSDTDTDDDSAEEDSDEEEDEEDDDSDDEDDNDDADKDSKDPEAMEREIDFQTNEQSNNEEDYTFKEARCSFEESYENIQHEMSLRNSKDILPILTSAIYQNALGYLSNTTEPLFTSGFLTSTPTPSSNNHYVLPAETLTDQRQF